ncbi:hypothetical protein HTS61_21970 [Escherichia coli]|nr:hypothetical protein [Escherichia coli]
MSVLQIRRRGRDIPAPRVILLFIRDVIREAPRLIPAQVDSNFYYGNVLPFFPASHPAGTSHSYARV